VEAGRFRQDLYFRLNVMRLRLAPLRERRDDVPALIAHFLGKYGNGHKMNTEVIKALQDYEWPGNIRELEHTVQQMVAMNSGPWITPLDLPSTVVNQSLERQFVAAQSPVASDPYPLPSSPYPSDSPGGRHSIIPLAEVEKRAILHAIDYSKGDRTVAAAMLGIGRTTLYRKLKEYGL
jgi:DNA-binding NtrC family response regulator